MVGRCTRCRAPQVLHEAGVPTFARDDGVVVLCPGYSPPAPLWLRLVTRLADR